MLVWRTRSTAYPGIYYSWSTDLGESWSFPATLSGIVARRWGSSFDAYDMATDSAGHIHLLIVGHLSETGIAPKPDQGPPGLYHFEWNGNSWSSPNLIYEGTWYPEYPHLVVHAGNQLHATWFAREHPWEATLPHQIWYAHGRSASLAVQPTLATTDTPPPPSPTLDTISPSPVPYPTLTFTDSGLPDRMRTESDEVLRLMVALAPVASIVLVVVAFKAGWLGRSK
jgi:hypothetical protein